MNTKNTEISISTSILVQNDTIDLKVMRLINEHDLLLHVKIFHQAGWAAAAYPCIRMARQQSTHIR